MNFIRDNLIVNKLLNLPIFNLVFWCLILSCLVVRLLFVFSTNIGYEVGEEDNIWNILNVIHGRSIYLNPSQSPYEIFLYPPISQVVYAGIIKVFAIKDIYWISVALRMTSLICNVSSVLLLRRYMLKKHCTTDLRNIINWLSLMAFITLIHLNWTVRVDALSVLISVVIILFSLRLIEEEYDNKKIIILSILVALSTFTKQDGIQFALIIPFAFVLVRRIKQGLMMFTFCFLSIAGFWFISSIIWGGNFYASVIGGVSNPTSISNAFDVVNRYFQLYSILPIVLISLSIWGVFKFETIQDQFLSFLVIGLFCFASVTSLKLGAWVNYFTLFNLTGVLLLSSGLKFIRNFNFAIVALICFIVYFFSGHIFHYLTPEFTLNKTELNEKQKLSSVIRKKIPKGYYIYTNDDILELYLYDKTIFPNQVFYNGMCTYKHHITKNIIEKTIVLKTNRKNDYVETNLLKFKDKNAQEIMIKGNTFLFIGSTKFSKDFEYFVKGVRDYLNVHNKNERN